MFEGLVVHPACRVFVAEIQRPVADLANHRLIADEPHGANGMVSRRRSSVLSHGLTERTSISKYYLLAEGSLSVLTGRQRGSYHRTSDMRIDTSERFSD
ncbi:hypothetical protein GCM10009006_14710 [Haloarcula argentinensis]|uniref:Uncharacterized protein n=1 Tax=Haloarcula argentinensis TaxID=43776 RepID=A0A830FCA3_HALAR|nr:hypothetical protein GCM10009006_14710 [Haloarcula argentinensis]